MYVTGCRGMLRASPLLRQQLAGRAAAVAGRQQPVDANQGKLDRLAGMATRSSFYREQLCVICRTAAIENALRHFNDYVTNVAAQERPSATGAAADSSSSSGSNIAAEMEEMRKLLQAFDAWFYKVRAPRAAAMRAPWTWFPRARMMRRHFTFHCGPTNSGKTHAALQALTKAKSGVYCAPLKALASQVWMSVNSAGTPCDLLIGDERQYAGFAEHVSCTMEMTPIDFGVAVGVIDEIQLIGDADRGWAWSRAVLGLPARHIHLCGEERALPVIQRLLAATGEDRNLQIIKHSRLVPLRVLPESLRGRYTSIKNADCVVTFSRKGVFQEAEKIRKAMPLADVRVIYGNLPFAVRQRETDAFNRGAMNDDVASPCVLVTTDAIAYGLNLSIRRIIFATMRKFDGKRMGEIPKGTALQVAGRAGRYGHGFVEGQVCALHDREHAALQNLIGVDRIEGYSTDDRITSAGLLPTNEVLCAWIESQRRLGTKTRFADLMSQFLSSATVGDHFFLCDMARGMMPIAEIVSKIDDMKDADRVMFCYAPLALSDTKTSTLLRQYAEAHAKGLPVELAVDVVVRAADAMDNRDARLQECEWAFRCLEAYCWLAFRFPGTFLRLAEGTALKAALNNTIGSLL